MVSRYKFSLRKGEVSEKREESVSLQFKERAINTFLQQEASLVTSNSRDFATNRLGDEETVEPAWHQSPYRAASLCASGRRSPATTG